MYLVKDNSHRCVFNQYHKAFGNFRDIMKLVSYSPLTAEHLTYVGSKSHSYNYRKEDKRDSRPDENYSRESMQVR